jgi:predicted extracellular nuclease
VTGVVPWDSNADEPRALDYNNYNQPGLYNPDAYRSSDHDPAIVELSLGEWGKLYLPMVEKD